MSPMRKKLAIVAGLLIVFSLVGVWQRTALWSWYCVRELKQADQHDRDRWIQRVVELDENALAGVLECLQSSDEDVCRRAEEVLLNWARTWTWQEARSEALLLDLHRGFPTFALAGQKAALTSVTGICQREEGHLPASLAKLAGQIVREAEKTPALLAGTLRLAGAILDRTPPGQWVDLCRDLGRRAFHSDDAEARSAALLLLLQPSLREDDELLVLAARRLQDSTAIVRSSALLVLGRQEKVVPTDDLLPLLHDDDAEVRRLCAIALRSRGIEEVHIEMARKIGDPKPTARLEVLEHLANDPDLDAGVWLRKMSQDPEPAVRAAVLRAASGQPGVNLRDRFHEMAETDPSATVRALARYYLR